MKETIENNSLNQSVSNSVSASTVVTANDQQPKTNSFLVILLSILLFISVSIAGFFAYQTQKLVRELTALKNTPTPVATIEPIATADPTADWKTYTNSKYSYTIMCPQTSTHKVELENGNGSDKPLNQEICSEGQNQLRIYVYPTAHLKVDPDGALVREFESPSKEFKVVLRGFNDDYFNQIVSTFKFINSHSNKNTSEKEKIEVAAKSAFVKKIGQEPTTMYGLAEDSLVVIDDWAFGVITIAPVGEGAGPGANYFLARKINNVWDAKIDYTNEFKEWLKISPNGLVNPDLKKFLQ